MCGLWDQFFYSLLPASLHNDYAVGISKESIPLSLFTVNDDKQTLSFQVLHFVSEFIIRYKSITAIIRAINSPRIIVPMACPVSSTSAFHGAKRNYFGLPRMNSIHHVKPMPVLERLAKSIQIHSWSLFCALYTYVHCYTDKKSLREALAVSRLSVADQDFLFAQLMNFTSTYQNALSCPVETNLLDLPADRVLEELFIASKLMFSLSETFWKKIESIKKRPYAHKELLAVLFDLMPKQNWKHMDHFSFFKRWATWALAMYNNSIEQEHNDSSFPS